MIVNGGDISIVFQGPIDWRPNYRLGLPATYMALEAARRILPHAEIVLSTWKGEEVRGLDYDVLLLNEDPGPQHFQSELEDFVPNNVNRQIRSTVNGIKATKRDLVLKARTDCILQSKKFLDVWKRHHEIRPGAFKVFEHRILSNNFTSRNPRNWKYKCLFHPSDHMHFGFKPDLLSFWDVPLQTTEDGFYFLNNDRPDSFRAKELARFAPEQHLCVKWLEKAGWKLKFKHYADYSPEMERVSGDILRNNFIFMKDAQFGFLMPKYHTAHHARFEFTRYQLKDSLN